MDKGMLKQYESLRQEVNELKQRIIKNQEQIARMESKYSVADVVSGGDGGIRHYKVEGFPYPEYYRQKSLLYSRKLRFERMEKKLNETLDGIEEEIAAVEDSRMRRILTYRYTDAMTWGDIAKKIGGRCTADAVRMEHDRFLQRQQRT